MLIFFVFSALSKRSFKSIWVGFGVSREKELATTICMILSFKVGNTSPSNPSMGDYSMSAR